MSTADILGAIAIFAGLVMASAPILQIRRMRRTRSSNDVSLQYLGMLNVGFVAFIAYGWSRADPVLLITNFASLSMMTITILIALFYRRGGAKKAAIAEAAIAEAALAKVEAER
jgi:uncharacterized protein with PQ loop repeat